MGARAWTHRTAVDPVAVVSGFFDGGYADARMTSVERGYQMLLVAALVVVAALAARRFAQVLATR